MTSTMLGIGIPIAYLAIGFTWSKYMLPTWWSLARKEYGRYDGLMGNDDDWTRTSVKEQWFWKAVSWPVWVAIAWIDPDTLIDGGDPELKRRRLDEREREIKRLEKELGIR